MLFKFCRYVVALFIFILSGNCFHAAADVIYTIQVVDSVLGTTIPKAEALVFLPGDSVLGRKHSPFTRRKVYNSARYCNSVYPKEIRFIT